MNATAAKDPIPLVPMAGAIVDRLTEIEAEARLLRKLLPLALEAQLAREARREWLAANNAAPASAAG